VKANGGLVNRAALMLLAETAKQISDSGDHVAGKFFDKAVKQNGGATIDLAVSEFTDEAVKQKVIPAIMRL